MISIIFARSSKLKSYFVFVMIAKLNLYRFPKGISTKWNENSLDQELNSTRRVYFPYRNNRHASHTKQTSKTF